MKHKQYSPAVRCEACDAMLSESDMGDALCYTCKHAVAMCLDMDDDDLAFNTINNDPNEVLTEDVTAEDILM